MKYDYFNPGNKPNFADYEVFFVLPEGETISLDREQEYETSYLNFVREDQLEREGKRICELERLYHEDMMQSNLPLATAGSF